MNHIDAQANDATIAGGAANAVGPRAQYSVIAGGTGNTIGTSVESGTIGGGRENMIDTNAWWATIGGGYRNTILPDGSWATISGGESNLIETNAQAAVVSGGFLNKVEANSGYSIIGGGWANIIQTNAIFATISGGMNNVVAPNSWFATIPGGSNNAASGVFSFAAGRSAKALQAGTFVWADSTDVDFVSTTTNEFSVRATGGVRFVSGVDSNGLPVAGVALPAGSGSWSSLSDRNAKENRSGTSDRRPRILPPRSTSAKMTGKSPRSMKAAWRWRRSRG